MLIGLNSKQTYFGVDQGFIFWAGLQRHLRSAPCTPDVCLASRARGPSRAGLGAPSVPAAAGLPFQLAAERGEHSLRSTARGRHGALVCMQPLFCPREAAVDALVSLGGS